MQDMKPEHQVNFIERNIESLFDLMREPAIPNTVRKEKAKTEDDVFDVHYEDFKCLCEWICHDLEDELGIANNNLNSAEFGLKVIDKFKRKLVSEL